MSVYGLVIDHPPAATTGTKDGFKIEKRPEGERSIAIWFERIGYIEKDF